MKQNNVYINREISWILFNERVLEEGEAPGNPLMERLKFLSIFMSNFDEFYRVRVGALRDRKLLSDEDGYKSSKKNAALLRDLYKATGKLIPRYNKAFSSVLEGLGGCGVYRISEETHELSRSDRDFLKHTFIHDIAPLTSPYIIGKKHPFPFFENGHIIIGIMLKTQNGNTRYGLIPLPISVPRIIMLPGGGHRFILAEDLILMFAAKLFHKFTVKEKIVFSITRNADIDENEGLYDYDIDLRDTMSKLVERRSMLAPVAVKYNGRDCNRILKHLSEALCLKSKQIFRYDVPIDMQFVTELEHGLPRGQFAPLYYPPVTPVKCAGVDDECGMLDRIAQKDLLLSCPFEDVSAIIKLLEQAAEDDRVESIYMTLYRAARNSKIVSALIDASKKGKMVTCVVELRARFDEENNIDWSGRLQESGCRVLFGLPMVKVHAKLLLIEMSTGEKQRICLVGTGNFNEVTARFYTDVSLMTSHRGITGEVRTVFEALEKGEFVSGAEHLLVSPLCLKPEIMNMIDREIENKRQGKPAAVVLKLNSLTDKDLMGKLYEAARAGVRVRMIVRGICCIVPGIEGKTENIEVRSIVGRYLEHSRIYAFGTGRARKYYISSADFMTRNTTQRVEVAVPIYDRECKAKLSRILNLNLCDNVQARVMLPDGRYKRATLRRGAKQVNSQQILLEQ